MKKILVIYYSQSGQLKEILNRITQKFNQSTDIKIDYYPIKPIKEYPFPWDNQQFFGAFPDTFLANAIEIEPPPAHVLETDYDLIIFGYQIWFLSPSLPVTSFLKSDYAKQILNNKPIVSVIGCRNMWITAHEKFKQLIQSDGGKIIGHIVLRDRHINHISVLTIVHWMMTGKKTKYLGVFPLPGVSKKDIEEASKFGKPIQNYLLSQETEDKKEEIEGNSLQSELLKLKAVEVSPLLYHIENKAQKIFSKWANLVKNYPQHKNKIIKLFNWYLIIAIWLISPIVMLIYFLTLPFLRKKNQLTRTNFESVN